MVYSSYHELLHYQCYNFDVRIERCKDWHETMPQSVRGSSTHLIFSLAPGDNLG